MTHHLLSLTANSQRPLLHVGAPLSDVLRPILLPLLPWLSAQSRRMQLERALWRNEEGRPVVLNGERGLEPCNTYVGYLLGVFLNLEDL